MCFRGSFGVGADILSGSLSKDCTTERVQIECSVFDCWLEEWIRIW